MEKTMYAAIPCKSIIGGNSGIVTIRLCDIPRIFTGPITLI